MTTHHGQDPLSLDGQLCFAIYAASRAVTGLYRDLLADLGLTYPQYLVMLALWERDPVAVRDLGRLLRLDSGTLSPMVRRMQERGLVVRAPASEDERVVLVALTARGAALRERAVDIPRRVLRGAGVSPDQADELRLRLDQITESVAGTAGCERPDEPTDPLVSENQP